MNTVAPIVRDIVLVGGGHSHALLIRRWGMEPLPGVRLTLVSRDVLTPYSGMLPGLVAGHYTADDVHVDLTRLCVWAGVRFIRAEMTGLDPARRVIVLGDGRPPLAWDLLSLDTGSTPDLDVPGAREHVTPVKPVSDFHARWQAIRARVETADRSGSGSGSGSGEGERVRLGVVGSGAGGFELIAAMRHALPAARADCHWFLRRRLPMSGRPARLGRQVLAAARLLGVEVHTNFDVARVTAAGVTAVDGRAVPLDETLWCTGATGPDWPRAAGLATDTRGFVATDRHLRSVSHPRVFATGDIGTQQNTPSAKAGVFAVRQAPVLFENLRRTVLGQALASYRPQRDFLSLLATGGRSAIACRGPLVVEGDWVWRWKDRIDGAFMARFRTLPPMPLRSIPPLVPAALLTTDLGDRQGDSTGVSRDPGGDPGGSSDSDLLSDDGSGLDRGLDGGLDGGMRCRGCGAKVGAALLDDVLGALPIAPRDDVLSGVAEGADAAVLDPGDRVLVQSVDQLDAIVDDPWIFGRIAALHALSDVVTEPVRVHSAQVLVTVPHAHARVTRRELSTLMGSIVRTLDEEGASLVGGHTAEGNALTVGLVVNGLRDRAPAPNRRDPQVGDRLVLTQPLGVGTLFAGLARTRARGVDVDAALAHMGRSNTQAAAELRAHGSPAMTDITGFGLLGHLVRLLSPAGLSADIDVSTVPLLDGAFALADEGVRSSLWAASSRVLDEFDAIDDVSLALRSLLCDPQTGGGLLGIVPADRANACLDALHGAGYADSAIVGTLGASERHRLLK